MLKDFIRQQYQNWPELEKDHQKVGFGYHRQISVLGLPFYVRYLPHRISSTLGKYTARSSSSPLVINNLLPKQQSFNLRPGYDYLVNPFPIFPEHGIICSRPQRKQHFYEAYADMKMLAKSIGPEYVLMYNGSSCGASIPQHWHVHVIPKKPFEDWFTDSFKSGFLFDGLRKAYILHNNESISGIKHDENYINAIIGYTSEEELRQIIFFRKAHRHRFYPKDPENPTNNEFLISPGVVDVLGHLTCVRELELKTLSEHRITQIFKDIFI